MVIMGAMGGTVGGTVGIMVAVDNGHDSFDFEAMKELQGRIFSHGAA